METFLSFGGALVIVIGAILLTSWAAKYLQTKNSTNVGRRFKLLERIVVGKDSYVVLLAFEGKYYLLGVGAQNVTLLEKFDALDDAPENALTDSFKSKLKAFTKSTFSDEDRQEMKGTGEQ